VFFCGKFRFTDSNDFIVGIPAMTCRKCDKANPVVYFAPIAENNTCICLACAKSRQWLDKNDNLKEGVAL